MGNAMNELKLRGKDWSQMLKLVERALPDEACGLIGGKNGISKVVYGVTNELNSSVRFKMEAHEQVQALLKIEESGLDLLAIYHSHPSGPAQPSRTDIDEFAYPGVPYLIWHLQDGEWSCRAFTIDSRFFTEIDISVFPVE
jgi:proteasome lid subunit RPN8/RPN11